MARWSSMTSRAAIMLACLVLVPLAALFGTSLPENLRAKLAGPGPRRPLPAAVAGPESAMSRKDASAANSLSNPTSGARVESRSPRDENSTVATRRSSTEPAGSPSVSNSPGPAPALPTPRNAPRPDLRDSSSSAAPSVPPAAPFVPEDRLHGLLLHLQDLGADHYRLERSPTAGGQFWFTCTVHGIREPFQSADPDPIRAVEQVARQVESWRNAVR